MRFVFIAIFAFTVSPFGGALALASRNNSGAPQAAPQSAQLPSKAKDPNRYPVVENYGGRCRTATAQPFLDKMMTIHLEKIKRELSKIGIEIVSERHNYPGEIARIVRVPGTSVQALASSPLQLVSSEGVVFDVEWRGQRLDPNGRYMGGFDYVNACAMFFENGEEQDSSGRLTSQTCLMVDKTEAAGILNHSTRFNVLEVGF